jgi:methenyltetrahydromethanopterin cyclohydrolase
MERDNSWPSVNRLAAPLVARLVADAQSLGIGVEHQDDGTTLVDGGIDCVGSLEAGLRVAEICMGALGSVRLEAGSGFTRWPWHVSVQAANPVLACLGSQYAGWSLSHGAGKGAYTALGSGPGRALAVKEPLFQELAYTDQADEACLVLEVDRRPPAELVRKIQRDCGVQPDGLTLILTPTTSLAGTLQVVARVLEVALHKVHELGFPLERPSASTRASTSLMRSGHSPAILR